MRDLQRDVAQALFRPLARGDRMQSRWVDGRPMTDVAADWIKPNDRLTSFERLQIYNRCYWFRILDCLYDDYPGLRSILGLRKFQKLSQAYLARFPSASFTLRDLGSRLVGFLEAEPAWIQPHEALALDMARFEWAQVIAFDSAALKPVHIDDLLGCDPAKLTLGLQPYVTLLELAYPVDQFALAIKSRDAAGLSDQASNTRDSAPTARPRAPRVRLPKPAKSWVAVHRHNNLLFFKQLEPEQFLMLQALQGGAPLEQACGEALERYSGPIEEFPAKVRAWCENAASLGWFCDRRALEDQGDDRRHS